MEESASDVTRVVQGFSEESERIADQRQGREEQEPLRSAVSQRGLRPRGPTWVYRQALRLDILCPGAILSVSDQSWGPKPPELSGVMQLDIQKRKSVPELTTTKPVVTLEDPIRST